MLLAAGHIAAGLAAFFLSMFAVCWAWINFSWFASAYDTDDWIYRLTTMLQMVGVIILALGLPPAVRIDRARRARRQRRHGRRLCGDAHRVGRSVAARGQAGPAAAQGLPDLRDVDHAWPRSAGSRRSSCTPRFRSPWLIVVGADRSSRCSGRSSPKHGSGGTPWHAHHIAERYGLFTIIALGEGVVGTVASLSAVVGEQGWSIDAVFVGVAGTGLTFGMWWIVLRPPAGRPPARPTASGPSGSAICTSWCSPRSWRPARVCTPRPTTSSITPNSDRSAPCSSVVIPVGVYILTVYVVYALMVRTRSRCSTCCCWRSPRLCSGRGGAARRGRDLDGQLPAGRHAGAGGVRRRIRTASGTGTPADASPEGRSDG